MIFLRCHVGKCVRSVYKPSRMPLLPRRQRVQATGYSAWDYAETSMCAYTYSHTDSHMEHMRMSTHAHMHACASTRMHAWTRGSPMTCVYTHAESAGIYADTHAYKYKWMDTDVDAAFYVCMQACGYACMSAGRQSR